MVKSQFTEYFNKKLFSFFYPHTLTIRLNSPVYRGLSGEGKCEGNIPIRAKFEALSNARKINIGEIMKRQTVGNVKLWKKKNLRINPMIKRRNILCA